MISFKKFSTSIAILMIIIFPLFTLAQGRAPGTPSEPTGPTQSTGTSGDINIPNPLKNGVNDFMSLITLILNSIVLPIAAIGVVVFIIYAGFKYVLAQGNPAEIKKAHDRLLWGLVGAGIILGAAGISKVVQNTINGLIK